MNLHTWRKRVYFPLLWIRFVCISDENKASQGWASALTFYTEAIWKSIWKIGCTLTLKKIRSPLLNHFTNETGHYQCSFIVDIGMWWVFTQCTKISSLTTSSLELYYKLLEDTRIAVILSEALLFSPKRRDALYIPSSSPFIGCTSLQKRHLEIFCDQ